MVTPAKHPNAPSRKRDGANKTLIAVESGLQPLNPEVPQQIIDEGPPRAIDLWNETIVPLARQGMLKEVDRVSCIHYCLIGSLPMNKLSGVLMTTLARLKADLGLTPKARLNLTSGDPPKTSLADVMRLGGK